MHLLVHPLTVNCVLFASLRPQLVCLRGCLFCSRKEEAAVCQRHRPREQLGRKEHKILVIFIWVRRTESAQKRTQKETFLPQKARHAHPRGARYLEGTSDNETQGEKDPLFSAHSGMPRRGSEIMGLAQLSRECLSLLTAVSQDQPDSLASAQEA